MTNFEKYMTTIINICNQDSTVVAVAMDIKTGALRRCSEVGCESCKFSSRFNDNERCEVNLVRWLLKESVPKLTKAERGFCEILQKGYIARDENGNLFIYDALPIRSERIWSGFNWRQLDCSFYLFITWESGKAWSIEELLKLEVEE